jgi:type IV pilus assembly protein PilW
MRADQPLGRAHTRGFSLVELMIGLVIGLLVSLAALSSLRIFTNEQRQGTVSGAGVLNAAAALGAIKNDVAAVGLGFFDGRRPMCDRLNLSFGGSALFNSANFSPLSITRTLGNDQIDVLYAGDVSAGAALPITTASDGTQIKVDALLPALVGQTVLLSPATTGLCTVRTVTATVAGTVDTPQILNFGAAGLHNQANFNTAPAYAAHARASLLGQILWHRYRLVDGNLVLEQPLNGTTAVLVRNVIALRAEYGVSASGGTTLQDWQDPTDAGWSSLTAANIGRVRALRLGLVTRVAQREKADTSGNCTASAAKPKLFDVEVEPDVTDWRCFRFRNSTLVVPLRNLVWGQVPA